jgi:hypothetical protein
MDKNCFEGTNPRQALDEAVRISNREILYKMGEFGYTSKWCHHKRVYCAKYL